MTSQLAKRLAGGPAPDRRRVRCTFGRVLLGLDDEARALVLEAVDNPAWSDAALVAILADDQRYVHHNAIGVHRRGQCSCKLLDEAGL